jgi:hypothetical protein
VGTGLELPVAPAFAVRPYVNFERATDFNRSEWQYGVKASYRLNGQWSAVGDVRYVDVRHGSNFTSYSLGVSLHF